MKKRAGWMGLAVLLWASAAVGQFGRIDLSENAVPVFGGGGGSVQGTGVSLSPSGTDGGNPFGRGGFSHGPGLGEGGLGGGAFGGGGVPPDNVPSIGADRTQGMASPPDGERWVRVELKSRPLDLTPKTLRPVDVRGWGLDGGAAARERYEAARHDHVFVYDLQTGMLLTNIGWTGESGQTGKTFDDRKNLAAYDSGSRDSLTMRWDDYLWAEEGFRELTKQHRYELTNAAKPPQEAARQAYASTLLFAFVGAVLEGMASSDEPGMWEAAVTIARTVGAIPDAIGDAAWAAHKTARDLETNPDYFQQGIVCDPDLLDCFPSENCQLWARNFFQFLKTIARLSILVRTNEGSAEELLGNLAPEEWLSGGEPVEEESLLDPELDAPPSGTPCFSCMLGDLTGTCSTPGCPNYGRPHRDYKP